MKTKQFIIYFFIFLFLGIRCNKEYPIISYLRPQQKYVTGFLDYNNYQWTQVGYVFDIKNNINKRLKMLPSPLPVDFDESKLITKKEMKQDKKYFILDYILKTDFLALEAEGIDFSSIDPEIVEINKIKKSLLDYACLNAQVKGIFGFIEKMSQDNVYISKNKNPISYVNLEYVPAPDFYTIGHKDILRNYEKALNQSGFEYEVLREESYHSEEFDCRMALLFRKKDLVLKAPTLQDSP